jgi:hypothetical protein
MLAIKAESQAQEVGLLGIGAQTVIGKIAEFVGIEVEHREGLLFARTVSSIAAVKENSKVLVGRNGRSRREIVDLARRSRDASEKLRVGKRCAGAGSLRDERRRHSGQDNDRKGRRKKSHAGIIRVFEKIQMAQNSFR